MVAGEWMISFLNVLLGMYLKEPELGQEILVDDVENLRETVRTLLEFVGARPPALAELWQVCTGFRIALDEYKSAGVMPGDEKLIDYMLESKPIVRRQKQPLSILPSTCPFLEAFTADLEIAITTMRNFHLHLVDLDDCEPTVEDIVLCLIDVQTFLGLCRNQNGK